MAQDTEEQQPALPPGPRRLGLGRGLLAALALLAAAATAVLALDLRAIADWPWPSLAGSPAWRADSPRARVASPLSLPPEARPPADFSPGLGAQPSVAAQCFATRDYGVIPRLANSSRAFCAEPVASAAGDAMVTSSYTHFELRDADLMATTFRHLRLDLRAARVAHDISAASQDGSAHDPRLAYAHNLSACSCAAPQDRAHGAPRVWRFAMSGDIHENFVACSARPMTQREWLHGLAEDEAAPLTLAARHAVILARKDDHNVFAQLSALVNAWIALRAAAWPADATQLVFLDKGLPTPIDELQRALLAPTMPVIRGQDVHGRVLHLESALVAPFEASGPLSSHLGDKQPCQRSQLLAEFRRAALAAIGIGEPGNASDTAAGNATGRVVVTVVSRRAYDGRSIPRVWRNEAEVLERMRADFGERFAFRSVDFARLPMREQMAAARESDVLLGMHGAGMAHAMWTRPGALVVEIFPRRSFQWAARNLCQFLGCDWHEFRGGEDHKAGRDPNPYAMDKTLDYDEWKAFIDPLLRARLHPVP